MKKRLLLITSGFPYGETERSFLSEEVKHLAATFDVTILALDNGEPLLDPPAGIRRIVRYQIPSFRESISIDMLADVFSLSTFFEVLRCLKGSRGISLADAFREILYFRFKAWVAKEQISKLMKEESIDIVYSYWCTGPALAAVLLKKRHPHLKAVTRFHGMDLYEERTTINRQPFRREIAAGADGLCFACLYGLSYFKKRWGANCGEKMRLCYLGSTDRGLLEPQNSDVLRIVSCSNLVPLKQVELIIEGLANMPETVETEWNHFGDGEEREKLEALAVRQYKGKPNIKWKFHGFVPNAELAEEYRKLSPDLFITTSSTEGGAPVSIQEVFSMGIPAIGTPIGGIPDLIIDGQTGFLLPERTEPAHVAEAIMCYRALPEERKKQMRSAVRQHWSDKFDAVKNAADFTDYLLELVSS